MTAETLPGLDNIDRPAGILEQAARRQLAALADAGKLNDGHAMIVALVLELCGTIAASRGRAAGVAMAARQLLDALDKLPVLADEAGGNEWGQIVDALGPPAVEAS